MPISEKKKNWYGDKESTEDCQIFSKKNILKRLPDFQQNYILKNRAFGRHFFLDSPYWIYPLYT